MRIVYFITLYTFVCDYAKNQGLANSLNEIADMNNVLGAKNLVPNNAESQTVNGVTFTVNSDGSVTVNGTASADTTLFLLDANQGSLLDDRGKSLVLSGRPTEGVTLNGGSCQLTVGENVNNTWVFHSDNGSGETFTLNSSRLQNNAYIWITSGVTLANAVFKPMLRLASIQDDTYVPYSMTNRELSDNISNVYTKSESDNRYIPKNSGLMIKVMDGVLTYQPDTTKTIGQYIDALRDKILNDIKSLLVGNEFASIKSIFYNYSDYVMENTPIIDRNSTTFDIRMSSLNFFGTSSQFISTIYKFGTANAQFGETEINMNNSSVTATIKTSLSSPNQQCYVFYSIYKNV